MSVSKQQISTIDILMLKVLLLAVLRNYPSNAFTALQFLGSNLLADITPAKLSHNSEAQKALEKIFKITAVRNTLSYLLTSFKVFPTVVGLPDEKAAEKCPFGACYSCYGVFMSGQGSSLREPTIYFNTQYPVDLHPYLIFFELVNLTFAKEYFENDVYFKLGKISSQQRLIRHNGLERRVGLFVGSTFQQAKALGHYSDRFSDYDAVLLREYKKRHRCEGDDDFLNRHDDASAKRANNLTMKK